MTASLQNVGETVFWVFSSRRARPAFFDFCLHRFTFRPQVVEM